MAIDSANKRRGVMSRTLPWRSMLPFPDGTFSSGDRVQLLYRYPISLAAAIVPAGVKIINTLMEAALRMELGLEGALTMTFEME